MNRAFAAAGQSRFVRLSLPRIPDTIIDGAPAAGRRASFVCDFFLYVRVAAAGRERISSLVELYCAHGSAAATTGVSYVQHRDWGVPGGCAPSRPLFFYYNYLIAGFVVRMPLPPVAVTSGSVWILKAQQLVGCLVSHPPIFICTWPSSAKTKA